MPASIIDSSIFGNIFGTEAMRRVWSDEHRTAKYLEFEAALAKVQGRLGIIPKKAADEIVKILQGLHRNTLGGDIKTLGQAGLAMGAGVERAGFGAAADCHATWPPALG